MKIQTECEPSKQKPKQQCTFVRAEPNKVDRLCPSCRETEDAKKKATEGGDDKRTMLANKMKEGLRK